MSGSSETKNDSVAMGQPYCSACGYSLIGLTESTKCPECGRPIVEVLRRHGEVFAQGKRYRSKATLFGLPVVAVAFGPAPGEKHGHAKGIIAIGDFATGGIAIGNLARGVVAVGGVSFGILAIGGCAFGVMGALGGLAVGAMAVGGGALGLLAHGGGVVGIFAQGGGAMGLHTRMPGGNNPAFAPVAWFLGQGMLSIVQPILVLAGLDFVVAAVIGGLGVAGWFLGKDERANEEVA